MNARYRIRRKPFDVIPHGDPMAHPDGKPYEPYGLWDTQEHCWVDKWGQPDPAYWACCRDVATMRRRDLNGWLSPIQ